MINLGGTSPISGELPNASVPRELNKPSNCNKSLQQGTYTGNNEDLVYDDTLDEHNYMNLGLGMAPMQSSKPVVNGENVTISKQILSIIITQNYAITLIHL